MVTKDFSDISKRHSHLKHTAHTGIFEDDNIMVVLAVPNSNSTVTLNAATVTIKTFNELKFKTQAELDVSLKAIEVKVDKIKDLQTGKDRFIGVRRVDKPGVYRSNRKEIFGTVISPDRRTKPAERKNEFSRVFKLESPQNTMFESKYNDFLHGVREVIEAYVPPKPLPPKGDNDEAIIDEPLAALVAKSKDPAMYVSGKKGVWIKFRTFK